MFRRFLSGFISCFPFVSFSDKYIKYFPREVYVNDWKVISSDIRKIIKNSSIKN